MRYWIWWNDLVQGPFEVFELKALASFNADLPVCPEGQSDWVPAGRVIELVISSIPPPAPPRPPRLNPLQGEFFSQGQGQEFLFDVPGENTGPYDYLPVTERPPQEFIPLPVTMPIRFFSPAAAFGSGASAAAAEAAVTAEPAITPPSPAWEFVPEPMRDSIPEPETIIEVDVPPVIAPPPVHEKPIVTPIPPKPEPEPEPEPKAPPVFVASERQHIHERQRIHDSMAAAEAPPVSRDSASLWPWFVGFVVLVAAAIFGASWWVDHSTSQAAVKLAEPIVAVTTTALPPPQVIDPPPEILPPPPEPPKPVVKKPKAKPLPKPKPKPKPVVKIKPQASVIPIPDPIPVAVAVEPSKPVIPVPEPEPMPATGPTETPMPNDAWKDRQNEAIQAVMKWKILSGKSNVGTQAEGMLEQMHDKELLHAMETGERLYLPDKMAWAALREEGPRYRVYLNFSAVQAGGNRVQTRSYQFVIDLKSATLTTDDAAAQGDFLSATEAPSRTRQNAAKDLDNILSGVDGWNKQKLRALVVRGSKAERDASEKIIQAARDKVRKSIIYFRTQYPESALQNAAKAYTFTELLK